MNDFICKRVHGILCHAFERKCKEIVENIVVNHLEIIVEAEH